MCRSVPKASPGTTARCASFNNRSANCSVFATPFFPSAVCIFRIGVKSPFRFRAFHSGNLAQPLDH